MPTTCPGLAVVGIPSSNLGGSTTVDPRFLNSKGTLITCPGVAVVGIPSSNLGGSTTVDPRFLNSKGTLITCLGVAVVGIPSSNLGAATTIDPRFLNSKGTLIMCPGVAVVGAGFKPARARNGAESPAARLPPGPFSHRRAPSGTRGSVREPVFRPNQVRRISPTGRRRF